MVFTYINDKDIWGTKTIKKGFEVILIFLHGIKGIKKETRYKDVD